MRREQQRRRRRGERERTRQATTKFKIYMNNTCYRRVNLMSKTMTGRSRNLVNLSLNVCCRCCGRQNVPYPTMSHAHKNIFYFFLFSVCVCVCVSSLIRICFGLVQQLSMARRVRFIIFFFFFFRFVFLPQLGITTLIFKWRPNNWRPYASHSLFLFFGFAFQLCHTHHTYTQQSTPLTSSVFVDNSPNIHRTHIACVDDSSITWRLGNIVEKRNNISRLTHDSILFVACDCVAHFRLSHSHSFRSVVDPVVACYSSSTGRFA